MKIEFEEISISEIELFYNQIISNIKEIKDEKVLLDLENVEKIDICGMQVFLALKKYCDNLDISLEFKNIDSPNLQESIKIYNLEKLFGMVP